MNAAPMSAIGAGTVIPGPFCMSLNGPSRDIRGSSLYARWVSGEIACRYKYPKGPTMTTHVTETTAAPSEVAIKHFQEMLAFETDCWDVHESLKSANPDFIVVDVRGPGAFAKGHVKGAINIPHSEMTATRMAEYQKDKVLVVYCAGPHCNGANKAALRLARLGLPVKMMIGGVTGWIDEGFTLTPS
jgi:rhodanese-related sulfurtransferase